MYEVHHTADRHCVFTWNRKDGGCTAGSACKMVSRKCVCNYITGIMYVHMYIIWKSMTETCTYVRMYVCICG